METIKTGSLIFCFLKKGKNRLSNNKHELLIISKVMKTGERNKNIKTRLKLNHLIFDESKEKTPKIN
tara:strand:+ start:1816 stop:2016 length:201 start_codon:yes stop_codon:yes gene_type:complete